MNKKKILIVFFMIGVAAVYLLLDPKSEKAGGEKFSKSTSISPSQYSTGASQQTSLSKPKLKPKPELDKADVASRDNLIRNETYSLSQDLVQEILAKKVWRKRRASMDEEERNASKKEFRGRRQRAEKELTDLLIYSPEAREEYLKIISDERDPYIKKELAGVTRRLSPELQEVFALELSRDPFIDNRKVGVEILMRAGTEGAFQELKALAYHDDDASVRLAAVESMDHFGRNTRIPPKYDSSAEINRALRGLTGAEYDFEIREQALRGLVTRLNAEPENRQLIAQIAESEENSALRDLARSALGWP